MAKEKCSFQQKEKNHMTCLKYTLSWLKNFLEIRPVVNVLEPTTETNNVQFVLFVVDLNKKEKQNTGHN